MGRPAVALLCLALLATSVLASTKPDPSRLDAGAMKNVQADAKAEKTAQLQQDEDVHNDAYGKPDDKSHDHEPYEKPYEAANERRDDGPGPRGRDEHYDLESHKSYEQYKPYRPSYERYGDDRQYMPYRPYDNNQYRPYRPYHDDDRKEYTPYAQYRPYQQYDDEHKPYAPYRPYQREQHYYPNPSETYYRGDRRRAQWGRRHYRDDGPKFGEDSTYSRDEYYWQSRHENKYYADSDNEQKYDDESDDYKRGGSYDNTNYDSANYYSERPKTISLIEDTIELLESHSDTAFQYKSHFICPDFWRTHPDQCAKKTSRSFRSSDSFLQDTLAPPHVGSCVFTFDSGETGRNTLVAGSPMCFYAAACYKIDLRCSIFHTAQKCADCDIKDTLSFNATGYINVFDALSCSERYVGVEATNNNRISGQQKTAAPAAAGTPATANPAPASTPVAAASTPGPAAATPAPASTPATAASTPAPVAATPATAAAAAPGDGVKASTADADDYVQEEVTIYRGTAATIEAEVTDVSSYGYGYESSVEELLKGAKVYYVGSFVPLSVPATIVRPTNELPKGVPFVTGGSFQIELKKKY